MSYGDLDHYESKEFLYKKCIRSQVYYKEPLLKSFFVVNFQLQKDKYLRTTFFLNTSGWTIQYLDFFSGLKPVLTKCEIAGIGSPKVVQLAVCDMKCIDLFNEVINTLGNNFSYSNTIKKEPNFLKVVSDVQTVLKVWWFRNLTLEGRTVVFECLAISEIVFQALIATVPSHIIKALEKIQTSFLRNNTNPKIKHKTICKNFTEGCLKNVDIRHKLVSLQISLVKRRLNNDCFHEREITPLYLLKKTFVPSFKFHSNLSFNKPNLKKLLPFNKW